MLPTVHALTQLSLVGSRRYPAAPALALGIVLQEATDGAMGVPEVLLAEALSNVVFCFVAGSPLLILRVTGVAVGEQSPALSCFSNSYFSYY